MSAGADELLTIDEVTDLLGISRMTLWRVSHNGDLTPVRVAGSGRDGAKRYSRQSLVDLLAKCTVRVDEEEREVDAEPELAQLIPLKAFALANNIPVRGFLQAARDKKFEHVQFNGRRYITPAQGDAFVNRNTVTVREDDERAAERERIDRSRARRSRRTTPRAAA
ncbi:helix-turn-helix transcriptional regulator [Micromonospora sp. NPDC047730]|uniref:helix-turn-helix transcriptional regulator n=1 Tax=Micromonospora sp. NPDC047730 TaxID=3364253 RepID=UPI0037106274